MPHSSRVLKWIIKPAAKTPGLCPPGGCVRNAKSVSSERWDLGVFNVLLTCILPLFCNEHESHVKKGHKAASANLFLKNAIPTARSKHQQGIAPSSHASFTALLVGQIPRPAGQKRGTKAAMSSWSRVPPDIPKD